MLTVTGTASRTRVLNSGPEVRSILAPVPGLSLFVLDFDNLKYFTVRRNEFQNSNSQMRTGVEWKRKANFSYCEVSWGPFPPIECRPHWPVCHSQMPAARRACWDYRVPGFQTGSSIAQPLLDHQILKSKNRVARGFEMIYIPSKFNERCHQNENTLSIPGQRRLWSDWKSP